MIYIISEKISDVRDNSKISYAYRCYYQPSATDIYLLDPNNFNTPIGVNLFGFGPEIIKKSWQAILKDVFANVAADVTCASLLNFIGVFKSDISINGVVHKYSDAMGVLQQLTGVVEETTLVDPSGVAASEEAAHHSV